MGESCRVRRNCLEAEGKDGTGKGQSAEHGRGGLQERRSSSRDDRLRGTGGNGRVASLGGRRDTLTAVGASAVRGASDRAVAAHITLAASVSHVRAGAGAATATLDRAVARDGTASRHSAPARRPASGPGITTRTRTASGHDGPAGGPRAASAGRGDSPAAGPGRRGARAASTRVTASTTANRAAGIATRSRGARSRGGVGSLNSVVGRGSRR